MNRSSIALEAVTVKAYGARPSRSVSQLDLHLRPILNSQEILRTVPGLFIGQHAGGGKAEQIFLRGFDIDHGTDIQLTVDGLPVNMTSHAHGQGYADLHFIIPELVEKVHFEKGPYQADKGNFVTAGWVDFRTKERLERNFTKLELGQYGTGRVVTGLKLLDNTSSDQHAYVAAEYSYSDSYFDVPQYFNRANVQARFSDQISSQTMLTFTASHFWSRWDHSGQIPERAFESGLISFFGAIDPTEGGETSRTNINLQSQTALAGGGLLKNQFYFSAYDFRLISNFTFFLEDAVNGDQIRQAEDRKIMGYQGSYTQPNELLGLNGRSTVGLQYRYDQVRGVELSRTRDRVTILEQIQFGNVDEMNAALFASQEWQFSRKWTAELGIRYDQFFSTYKDLLMHTQSASAQAGILSPKVNVSFSPNDRNQLYLNTGRGFHSNDTRVVVPRLGRDVLPAAYGADLGWVWKPADRLFIQPVAWYLWLDQEFVYVGDAGIVEAGGRTRRYGLDLSARYQLTRHLFADMDINWTRPRAVDEEAGENYIPLAPVFTTVGGLSLTSFKGFSGSVRYRYMTDRAANEDNSIIAEGYMVADLQLNYTRERWEIGLNIQNLTNTRWKETQFATESRLQNELLPVEEIHFTPGTPFFARLAFTLFF
jgi:outer membrane cobalamin receptor